MHNFFGGQPWVCEKNRPPHLHILTRLKVTLPCPICLYYTLPTNKGMLSLSMQNFIH